MKVKKNSITSHQVKRSHINKRKQWTYLLVCCFHLYLWLWFISSLYQHYCDCLHSNAILIFLPLTLIPPSLQQAIQSTSSTDLQRENGSVFVLQLFLQLCGDDVVGLHQRWVPGAGSRRPRRAIALRIAGGHRLINVEFSRDKLLGGHHRLGALRGISGGHCSYAPLPSGENAHTLRTNSPQQHQQERKTRKQEAREGKSCAYIKTSSKGVCNNSVLQMKTITSNNLSTVLPHRPNIEQRSNKVQPRPQNTYLFHLICLAELQILTINDLCLT